ncbi:MAG: hypothetical protein CM1200mP36_11390 [Gammaproteobacteria bacterium]|nr:MAG: hypothetical protein CM1200mP36_11390 [Gammaproteobacteria bacterium]
MVWIPRSSATRAACKGPAPPKANPHIVTWIASALGGDELDRTYDIGVGQADRTVRHFGELHSSVRYFPKTRWEANA